MTLKATDSKRRKLINKAGKAILDDFFDQVSTKPSKQQKLELLQLVVDAGNAQYTVARLTQWFDKHRSLLKVKSGTGKSSTVDSARRSETDFAVVCEENPHSPEELVDMWARTLNVPVTLIDARREEECIGSLQTPSPEIKLEEESASTRLITTSIVPEVPSPPKRKKKPTHSLRLLRAIGEGMDRVDPAPSRNSEWLPLSPSPTPSSSALSADELSARFAPYGRKMKSFLEKVGRGELEEKGWKAGWGFG